MSVRMNLGGSGWVFAGFHDEAWRFYGAFHRETPKVKDWLPARVPGSVHWDLLRAGEIPDPYFGQNSKLVEWVHQRQWVYKREFTAPPEFVGRRLFLLFEGIDYEAEVFLDGRAIGEHVSMFAPLRIDVTTLVEPGRSHHLAVVIKDAPREWGQLGRTSTVRTHKAHMGYWWDFATRLVHLGIWQDVWLEATGPVRLEDVWVRTALQGAGAPGAPAEVTADCRLDGAAVLEIDLLDPHGAPAGSFRIGGATRVTNTFTVDRPELWWPNGAGAQPLYRCRVRVSGPDNVTYDWRELTFGIRSFCLEQNPWPPAGAEAGPGAGCPLPYTFTVNGRRLFVKGYNWVPVDHMYGRPDLEGRYRQLIELARASGVNLIRVWGGGLIERELFYDLCDRAGIMIWQEFIQSSSGTDHVPPSDPGMLALLEREAEAIIPLRRTHPSLVLWCGGNELTDRDRRPATLAEPMLAMLARKVAELDPDRPFLPASPSGPTFGLPDDGGVPGDLHDVHGPWHYRGPVESYLPYFNSTALFHSEFGTQGALAPASLDRIMRPEDQWPPDDRNPLWVHHSAWWMQLHRVRELFGDNVAGIAEYWPLSQYLQAENLRYGVESNRRRWPVCSGTVIWQLNEPWPNGHCTNTVDYYLRPKMAYYYVRKAYAAVAASLHYENQVIRDGVLAAKPFVAADEPFTGVLRVCVADVTGQVWHSESHDVSGDAGVTQLLSLAWPLPGDCPDVLVVTLTLHEPGGWEFYRNPYLFSRATAPILGGLRTLPEAEVSARREGDFLVLTNHGHVFALFAAADIDDSRWHWRFDDNYPLIAPGTEAWLRLHLAPRPDRADPDYPHGRPAPDGPLTIRVTGWNIRPIAITWSPEV